MILTRGRSMSCHNVWADVTLMLYDYQQGSRGL